jgi:hypothetical protein
MASVLSAPRPVKAKRPQKPATADVEVLSAPAYSLEAGRVGTAGLITINGLVYGLVPLGRDSRQGFRLYKAKDEKVYDVDTEGGRPRCDCPDAEHQCGTAGRPYCKHALALIMLRKEGVI